MSLDDSDPRVFFAAERTLLAWLRTGLTIIALGFVIARFGLFLRLFEAQPHGTVANSTDDWSAVLGIGFVLTGSCAILVATCQHGRFISTLAMKDRPARYSPGAALGLSALVGVLGAVLALYLLRIS